MPGNKPWALCKKEKAFMASDFKREIEKSRLKVLSRAI